LAESLRIDIPGGGSVSALWTPATGPWAFVYAPGAGANLNDPFGAYAAPALAEAGIASLRFQFPYAEAHRPAPDRPPVLMATWRAALDEARTRAERLVAAGRSMGGRYASIVVAEDNRVDALALFAYPLHPAKRPDQRRDGHLPQIAVPTLFCSGDRDPYASSDELREVATQTPGASLYVMPGADHGFSTLKSSGRSREDVWREAVDALIAFLAREAE
jgi:predicted alpha/beta-hydrolase family hydrolase